MTRFFVYALIDPCDSAVRYIGKSCGGMRVPLRHALKHELARSHNEAKRDWITQLMARNLTYEIRILEARSSPDALSACERVWIALGRSEGWPLLNRTDGGDNEPGGRLSQDTKRKISMANRGRVLSAETRARMSAGQRTANRSREQYEKVSKTLTGHSVSAETRAKIAAANIKRFSDPEERAKIGRAQIGRVNSPETRAKQSESLKQTWARRKAEGL